MTENLPQVAEAVVGACFRCECGPPVWNGLCGECANSVKVAACEYLLGVNRKMDGPFIAPTAIDWLGEGLAAAVLGTLLIDGDEPPEKVQ